MTTQKLNMATQTSKQDHEENTQDKETSKQDHKENKHNRARK